MPLSESFAAVRLTHREGTHQINIDHPERGESETVALSLISLLQEVQTNLGFAIDFFFLFFEGDSGRQILRK